MAYHLKKRIESATNTYAKIHPKIEEAMNYTRLLDTADKTERYIG